LKEEHLDCQQRMFVFDYFHKELHDLGTVQQGLDAITVAPFSHPDSEQGQLAEPTVLE
jgi:hypothetical protein